MVALISRTEKICLEYFLNLLKLLSTMEELTKKHIGGNMYQVLNAGATSNDFMITCAKYYESNGHNAIINTLQY